MVTVTYKQLDVCKTSKKKIIKIYNQADSITTKKILV